MDEGEIKALFKSPAGYLGPVTALELGKGREERCRASSFFWLTKLWGRSRQPDC